MATVTKPMALDESIHTTDGNDTNIADLMQSGLASIATAIGAIPALDAANITYNNSTSGLAATHVGTAIDELASEKADSATTLAGYGITDAYTKAQTDAKIADLDYSDTAVSGSYVTEVDETDGVISVTREAADATPTENSQKMVTSGGVYTEISALNNALTHKQDTLTAGDGIDITSDVVSVDAEEKTTTSTFNTVNGGLLSSCVVTLEPVQGGSGTPSPTNIRPITGHTTADAQISGNIPFNVSINSGHNIDASGNYYAVGGRSATYDFIDVEPNGIYTLSYDTNTNNGIFFYDKYGVFVSFLSWDASPRTFTVPSNAYNVRFAFYTDSEITNPALESDQYVSTPLNQTVYGGIVDLVSGDLRVTHGYIASYNGETLSDEWISDRDEYVSGTTPTTGAEVVYKLTTPITVQLSKQQIKAIIGSNTITAPLTGQSVSASYREVMGYDSVEQAISTKMSYADNGVLGAKNLLPLSLDTIKSRNTSGTWSNNVYTYNGIDFTINTDSDGNVIEIVANGTASANAVLEWAGLNYTANTTYILNGCPEGGTSGGNSIFKLQQNYDSSSFAADFGSSKTFTPTTSGQGTFYVVVYSGYTVTDLTFYPMIRLATDTDSTFQPYAKTNLQLTNDVSAINTDLASNLGTLLQSTTSAWSGDTLTFTIAQSNAVIYHLVAMQHDGTVVDTYLINRTNYLIKTDISASTTMSYSDGVLTVTLPSSGWWTYSMEKMISKA